MVDPVNTDLILSTTVFTALSWPCCHLSISSPSQGFHQVPKDHFLLRQFNSYGRSEDKRYIHARISTWNPNDLYFWGSTPKNKARPFQIKTRVIWVPGIYTILYLNLPSDSVLTCLPKFTQTTYPPKKQQHTSRRFRYINNDWIHTQIPFWKKCMHICIYIHNIHNVCI